jgi:hypothetical protein
MAQILCLLMEWIVLNSLKTDYPFWVIFKMSQIDLELKSLNQFSGSEHYYNVMGINVTDGVKYIMDNGYGWAVTDAVIIIRMQEEVRQHKYVTVKLAVDKEKENATIYYLDRNEEEIFKQVYDWTTAARDFELMYNRETNVMYLPSED